MPSEYGVSATFNVFDLSPFEFSDSLDSRTSPFEEGGTDVNIESESLRKRAAAKMAEVDQNLRSRLSHDDPLVGMKGPRTRSTTNIMQEALNQLIREVHDNIELRKSNESTSVTVLQVVSDLSTTLSTLKSNALTNRL